MNIPDERTAAEVQEQTVLEEEVQMEKMQIVIGQKTYTVSLYENETTKSLKNLLPMTVSMEELNAMKNILIFLNPCPQRGYIRDRFIQAI